MENRRPQWAGLQAEVLELILGKLDLADHARFASVCSSWRSVAIENPPINKPLYFVLSHDPEKLVRRFITSFIPSWTNAWFMGAGLDGWLVIGIDERDLFLLNKGLNSIIQLPPLPKKIYNFSHSSDLCKVVLSSPPSSSSSGECTVVLLFFSRVVFYCHLGLDTSFIKLPDFLHLPGNGLQFIEDILFYKEQLFVLCYPNTIVIFDHLLNKVSQSLVQDFSDNLAPRRLLISGNNMLSIVAGQCPFRYSVFTMEWSETRLVQVNNIGDDDNFQILLSNHYCSLSITAKEHMEFLRASHHFNYDPFCFVFNTSKDPKEVKADDPWPLFFIMFNFRGIKNMK